MRAFLIEAGFPERKLQIDQWGNRDYIRAQMKLATRFPRRGFFGSLENEPQYPVSVWAWAQKG
jgi:hypothetical protein